MCDLLNDWLQTRNDEYRGLYLRYRACSRCVEAKKNERDNALKEVKRLCKEFGFTAGMLKGSFAEGWMKK